MMTFRHAFDAQSYLFVYADTGARILKITSGKYNPINGHYSNELKNIVKEMLQINPQDRPSVHSILEKPIIKKNLENVLNNTLTKFEETLPNLNNSKKLSRGSSSHRKILDKKRSS